MSLAKQAFNIPKGDTVVVSYAKKDGGRYVKKLTATAPSTAQAIISHTSDKEHAAHTAQQKARKDGWKADHMHSVHVRNPSTGDSTGAMFHNKKRLGDFNPKTQAKSANISKAESNEGLAKAHKSIQRKLNTPGGSSHKNLARLAAGVKKNIADPDHPGKTASLAKSAAEQSIPQDLRRALLSDTPVPLDKSVADDAITKLLRSRIRYGQDGSPVSKHGRMILREMGVQV